MNDLLQNATDLESRLEAALALDLALPGNLDGAKAVLASATAQLERKQKEVVDEQNILHGSYWRLAGIAGRVKADEYLRSLTDLAF